MGAAAPEACTSGDGVGVPDGVGCFDADADADEAAGGSTEPEGASGAELVDRVGPAAGVGAPLTTVAAAAGEAAGDAAEAAGVWRRVTEAGPGEPVTA